MNKEKLLLITGAVLIGIIVSASTFFIYQYSKRINEADIKKITIKGSDENENQASISLEVNEPMDEAVVDERVIKVIGKTSPNSTIVVVTEENEEGGVSAGNGSFSMDITLSDGENIIEVVAIAPNGEFIRERRIVTYTKEDF